MRGSLSTCFNRCVNTSQIKVQRLALLTLALLSPQVRANISAPANESNKQASVALWSNANPTALEQDALEHINRLRHNPVTELTRIFARYSLDPKITALLKPYQQRGLSGQLESLDITAARLLATISAEYDSRKKVLLMSTAPLCLYPLFKQRATNLREVFYSYEVASKVANSSAIFNPIYPGTQQPPTYLFSPIIPFSNTYSDMPLSSWSGPNATNGIVTFGPYGGNETMVTWTDLSTEGGIDLDAWCAFLFLSQDYPALFAQGPYTPSLALGNGRLAGVDISNRTGSPGNGDLILTIDIGDPQAFTSGSDLPYGPVNTVFITGVVYNDLNVNGVYDSGEGVANVNVSTPTSPYQAVTSISGGYCIPVARNTGQVLITIQSAYGNQSQSVSVGEDNTKADFLIYNPLNNSPLTNLSARSFVGGPNNPLIAGFVIAGNQNSSVLIRGVGPTLSQFGVTDALPSPKLIIYNSQGQTIAQNSGWFTNLNANQLSSVFAEVGAFSLPNSSADCALLLNLIPGCYTAQVVSTNTSTGQAMIEIYHVPST